MDQKHFFGDALWVGLPERTPASFAILRRTFEVKEIESATLSVLGLGFFKCYINGVLLNPDTFLPLSSDFEGSCDPSGEVLSGHRVYVPQFDITSLLREGKNTLAMQYGGGWYTHACRVFGLPKAIFCISVMTKRGTESFVSDTSCRIRRGYISDYVFVNREEQDLRLFDGCFDFDFDDGAWDFATEVEPLSTEYLTTDCPPDKLIRTLPVTEVKGNVYDCGINTTGYPVLHLNGACGETVKVRFSEAILADGTLDPTHAHKQEYTVISDGCGRTVSPEFTWFGFRYFEVEGDATPVCVKEIHADVRVTSHFSCSDEVLNWTYRTFLHTMLCNLHTGHPSDCPHIERRGYTGDGQLTCHAVLSTLGVRALYEKWMEDIADCQDILSGHIQYTAPYIRSGGGPGGWGCAIVEVPYQLYRHYGNEAVLRDNYGGMRRYIDYLEEHSAFGLVTSDKKGEWCLGDWCGPHIVYPDKDVTSHSQQVLIPAPMVNTYFMVKALRTMCEIARVIGKESDIPEYEEKIALRRRAIEGAYFNTFDGNFVMNVQGANAYAVDLGLGNEKTYSNMVRYYQNIGCFDTGIFATDILTRVLFEHGDADLAVKLLRGNGRQGFAHWMENGATTFHEYWNSNRSRSHSHPMFGAPVAYFFEYLLGIRQEMGTAGYKSLIIAPMAVDSFTHMEGSMETPQGTVAVCYRHTGGAVEFVIEIPQNTTAVFRYAEREIALHSGENRITV